MVERAVAEALLNAERHVTDLLARRLSADHHRQLEDLFLARSTWVFRRRRAGVPRLSRRS